MFYSNLHDSSFEDYFETAQKYRYNVMHYIEAYKNLNPTYAESTSSGGGRPMIDGSTAGALVSL